MAMGLEKQGRGGVRPGAGRPKKKKSELQKTHSIRATDNEWKEIQAAARIIKACKNPNKRPKVFMLDDKELADMGRFLLRGLIDERHDSLKSLPVHTEESRVEEKIELKQPENINEEESVSIFLEYYRLNPIEAASMVRSRLDREKRIRRAREARQEQKHAIADLDKKADNIFDSIDDINERVAKMLSFAEYE
jgi:hypothetical protein